MRRHVTHELDDQDSRNGTVGRVHPPHRPAEVLGVSRLVLDLEEAGEHRLELAGNLLPAMRGPVPLHVEHGDEREQYQDDGRGHHQDPVGQPERIGGHG